MKLMVICASLESLGGIAEGARLSIPFEIIHYSQALKAMDNIEEINPDAIIINACDFPRHWKTIVQFVRQERSRKGCPVIVLHGDTFTAEDADKAYVIGVNAMVPESLPPREKTGRIQGILNRYLGADGPPKAPPADHDPVSG
jgi:DNA-binding response OmpR family regulator